ncbi:transcriptional regulator with XRE-family HTH domain [Litorivivens lipolytica]|uniref:Transcriptional regulator with XRE-family HTH domain n=1 Tax=Litorivivens lipolytica TaxID=1524264 RepID=A0A7W4W6M1_9GAMM|nr:helix-turn-helix transcriptional regulator [Litorivivens lipolytica]MBB3047802.1 transcriptional regulator with XRE-family HTH domain [Litorivivens lipolytica]
MSETTGSKSQQPGSKSKSGNSESGERKSSLLDQLLDYTGLITGSIVEVVKTGSAIPLMYTDNWLKDLYMKSLDPERLRAMAEAGEFLKDAREVAGLNLKELAEILGLKDEELLQEVESGRATLPFDMILRIAALVARHDPIPFILKFVRTYNPALEQRLDELGIMQLPKQYERERRYVNLLRKHDRLRAMRDSEFEHFIALQEKAVDFSLHVLEAANTSKNKSSKKPSKKKSASSSKSKNS